MTSRALDQRLLNQATRLGLKGGVRKPQGFFSGNTTMSDPDVVPNMTTERKKKTQGEAMVKALRLR